MAIKQTSPLGLAGLADRMRALSSDGFRRKMAKNLAEEARTQTAKGFREERDPYGKKWAPLQSRKGKILQDTGRTRASVSTEASTSGFRIDIPVVYAAPHQYGAHIKPHSRIKSREMFHNPRTGRLVKKSTKLKLVHVSVVKRQTFANGIQIPQRQMLPMASTGGLGPIWTAAFNETATGIIERAMRGRD